MMEVKEIIRYFYLICIAIAFLAWSVYEIRTPDKNERGSFQMWLIITSVVICSVMIWAWS